MELKKVKSKTIFKYIGLFVLMCGLFMFIYHYCTIKNLEDKSNLKIEEFFVEETPIKEVVQNKDEVVEKPTTNQKSSYDYIAVLEIPSISLKRGLVNPDSYYNNVNYNIQIIEHSTMPDVVNGNLILAGHNGSSYISFFKNLYKVNENEKVYVYYQGYKYEYVINKIYDTPKDGYIEIYRDHDKSAITLITCKKNTKDTQTVYVGYLTNKEQY